MHLNTNPTQGELFHYEFKQKKEELRDATRSNILAKYGGAEYLESAPKELRQGQTEDYVEYSRSGHVIKGRERAKARSKYPEDGAPNRTSFLFQLTLCQCTLTITRLSGDLGTTLRQAHGATPAATQSSTFPTVPAKLEFKPSKSQAHGICSTKL